MAPIRSNRFTMNIVLSLLIFFSSSLWLFSSAFEFEVGGANGWIVPPANDTKSYNVWASEKRFQIGDTIRFKYTKDSVMEVNEEDYKNCNSTRPNFFSNNGNTVYPFHRSGYFYFISGATGHCQKGQQMIVRVMAEDQQDHHDDDDGHDSSKSGGGTTSSLGFTVAPAVITPASAFQFLLLYFASLFF